MNALKTHLIETIHRQGPMSVARYMTLALGHPEHGYYMKQDPLGHAGDFITAPEVSQMFGELIGLWVADLWQRAGGPAPFHLIELGPGRGTLMADALRAIAVMPGLADLLHVHLVEMSPVLKAKQQAALSGQEARWHTTLGQALAEAEGPTIIVANEFLDALPIHQLVRTSTDWRERMVGLDATGKQLVPTLADAPSPLEALIPDDLRESPEGSVVELCAGALDLIGDLGAHLTAWGGAALFIDYGHVRSGAGETLQAVAGHEYADPFDAPGDADLTAHVDFARIARAAAEAGLGVHGPVTQGAFLKALGIKARAGRLSAAAPERGKEIQSALKRLVGADEMGTLFKVAAVTAKPWPEPAGFDAP